MPEISKIKLVIGDEYKISDNEVRDMINILLGEKQLTEDSETESSV